MRRRNALAALGIVAAVAAVPAVAATTQPKPTASLLSDKGEQQVREALQQSHAANRALARRAPADPRRLAGLTGPEALRAAIDAYPALFATRPTRLLAPHRDERVKRYLGAYAARLDVPGKADAIVNSDLPLRVEIGGQQRPVDLVLVDRGDALAPAAPLVPSSFPDALGAGLTVGDDITVRLVGGDPAATAEKQGQQVFYANALPDADLLATPLPLGLETFVALRSPSSPRELRFEFGLPADARLEAQTDGGKPTGAVAIVRGTRQIGIVRPPVASDGAGAAVPVATKVDGRTLTLSVDVPADAHYPVLVDPIIEDQFPQPGNGTDPNGGFTNTRGWRRDSSVGLGAFAWAPNADDPAGNGVDCIRINNLSQLEILQHAMCVTTIAGLNYPISSTFQSIGAWTWRPPSGQRSSLNDNPVPNTDAFVFRANVRNGYVDAVRSGGNAVLIAGLISGRTHTWIGHHAVFLSDTSPVLGGAGPFLIDFSQSSFYGTYCAREDCSAELDDPVYDGTYMAWGVWAAGTGQQASALGQGAQLYQSDRTAPLVAHLPVSDVTRWYRNGTFTSRATATDGGMGMRRLGVLFAGQVTPSQVVLGCSGSASDPCQASIPFQNFTENVNEMPEGLNDVFGVGDDILGRRTAVPMTVDGTANTAAVKVKVDRGAPTVGALSGTLAAKGGRAVKDATYTLTATASDGAQRSGVKTITFRRTDKSVIQSFPMTCSGNDCPADAPAVTLNLNTATLAAGVQTISVIAEDSAGNVTADADAKSVTINVDHAAPAITTLTHTPALTGWIGSTSLKATATATDDASGVKRFTLTTPTAAGPTTSADTVVSACDDTIANACTSPVTRDVTYSTSTMGDGAARPVTLTASDALDQKSAARQWTVDVDTAGPALTLSGAAWNARDTYAGAAPLALQAQAVDSAGGQQRSGVARIDMRLDHAPPADPLDGAITRPSPCVSTSTQACDLGGTLTVPGNLSDGEHTVYVTATDYATPANTTTTSFKFYVDKTAPTITDLDHGPALFAQWRDDVPRTVDVSAHDDASGVARLSMTLPPNALPPAVPVIAPFDVTCTGPPASPCPADATGRLSYATDAMDQGVRMSATAVATDKTGNASAPAPWTLRLDRTPPAATYTGAIAQNNGGTLLGGSTDLHVDATDAFSGVQEIRFLVDGQERQSKQGACDDDGCAGSLSDTFVFNASSYESGARTLRVEISDRVGTPAARHVVVKQYTINNVAGSSSAPLQAIGLEDYWQYDSTPTGAGSAAHVNLGTGNLVVHKVPIVNRGRGLSSVVNLTYNSHETTGLLENVPGINLRYQEVGRGFSLAISGLTRLNQPLGGVTLAGLPTVPGKILLADADGTRHAFTRIGGTSQYAHPPGVNLRLRQFTAPPLIAPPGTDGKTWAITRPDGTTFYYDPNGYERSIVDRNGNTITFEYELYSPLTGNAVGTVCPLLLVCAQRVKRVVDAGGRAIDIRYRAIAQQAGMIDSIVDHRSLTPGTRRATRFIYDTSGYLKEIAEALTDGLAATPETRITKFAYTANGGSSDQQLRQITDPLGRTTDIEYAAPNPALQVVGGGGPPVKSITNRRGKKTTYAFGFFTDGTRTTITDPLARPTRYVLDAGARPTEKLDARLTSTKLSWDGNNNVQQLTMAAGTPDEAVTTMTYNPNGLLLTRTDPESTAATPKVLALGYRDGAGTQTVAADAGGVFVSDLTSITSAEGNATTFVVDPRGNVTSRTDGEGKTASTTFDAFGQIQTETDEVGNVTKYEQYDANGLPQQVVTPRGVAADPDASGGRWIYRYDAVGNVLSVTDPRAGAAATVANPGTAFTTTLTYDALDRPTKTSTPKDSPSASEDDPLLDTPDPTQIVRDTVYDLNDNITKRSDAEHKDTTATFSAMDQVETVSSPGVPHGTTAAVSPETTRYVYDDVDNVSRMVTPRGESTTTAGDFETEYHYDPVDEKVAELRRSTAAATGEAPVLATSWAYDRRGNQIGVVDPRQNERYASATPEENAQIPSRRRLTYQYDRSDNRRAQIEDPGGESDRSEWRYDRDDRMVAKVDPRGFEAGNTADDFTWRYGYDRRDLLTSVESPAVGHTGEANAARRRTQYIRRADGKIACIVMPRGTATGADATGCRNPATTSAVTADHDFETILAYDADGNLSSRTLPRAPGQYGDPNRPDLTLTYVRDAVGNPKRIVDPRHHTIHNAFYDSGALKRTDRPSWWNYDPDAMTIRERTLEEIMQAHSSGDTPREQSAIATSDFGDIKPEPIPDWMPDAGLTTFGYDAEMRLTTVKDAVGFGSTITRDALGRTTKTSRPFNVTAVRPSPDLPAPPAYIENAYTYDFDGNVLSTKDGEGNFTRYRYDQYDRRIRETGPGANLGDEVTDYTLDANGNATAVKTPRETTYRSGFDRLDRVTSSTDPEGDKTTYGYDAAGNKVSQTWPRGNVSGISASDREKHTTTWTYNRAGDAGSQTDGLGHATTFGYDRDANQVRVTAPGAASTPGGAIEPQVTTRTFDGRDLPWMTTTGTGSNARTMATEFDGNGNPRRSVNTKGMQACNGATCPDDYSAAASTDHGPLSDSTDANRHATVREFSDDDLLTAIHQPWGAEDGPNGNPSRKRFRMNFALDARGRVTTIDAPYEWSQGHSKAQRTKYGHYDNGWVRSVSDERIVNPADGQSDPTFAPEHEHDYIYDGRGLQTDWLSDKGRRIHRGFHPNGLLDTRSARISSSDTTPRIYKYSYNKNGSLTSLVDQDLGRTTTVTYDGADRPLGFNEDWNRGRDTVYEYDADSNVTKRKVDGKVLAGGGFDGGRETRFDFDEVGRETSMRVVVPGTAADRVTTTSYWPSDQVRTHDESAAKGAVESTFFSDDGRLSRMQRDTATSSGGSVKNQPYTYDENGNRTKDERGTYDFNARDQMIKWTRAKAPNTTVDYELNAAGAITKKTDQAASPQVTTYEYVENPTGATRFVGDRLIRTVQGSKTTSYDYNALGDVTKIHPSTGTDTTYTYDDFERRKSTTSGGVTESYTYDALDRRDTTTRAGSKTFDHSYVALTEQLSREQRVDAQGNVLESSTYDYDSGLRRQGQTTSAGGYKSYAVDANGSVEGLESSDGALAANNTYNYDPYGEIDASGMSDEAKAAPFRFQGFYSDSAVQTYDMQARSYRPDVGRFLSQDRFEAASADIALQSDPLTQNRYAFAGGNPINNVEFDGHEPEGSYTNGCDNTYGSDERCRKESKGRQAASAVAPTYAFSSNWARGRASTPAQDIAQAKRWADGNLALAAVEHPQPKATSHPKDCGFDVRCRIGRVGAKVGEAVVDSTVDLAVSTYHVARCKAQRFDQPSYCTGEQAVIDALNVALAVGGPEALALSAPLKRLLAPSVARLVARAGATRGAQLAESITTTQLDGLADTIRRAGMHPASRNQRVIAVGVDSDGGVYAGSSNGFDAGQRAVLEELGITRVPGSRALHAEEELLRIPNLKRVGTSKRRPCGTAPGDHNCSQQLRDAGVEFNP